MEDYINFNSMTFNQITLILLIQGVLTVTEVIQLRINYDRSILSTFITN